MITTIPNCLSKISGQFLQQPNAVDVSVESVYKIGSEQFVLTKDNNKTHRTSQKIEPDDEGFWVLAPGAYEVITEAEVAVANGECGFVISRSTLVRNGCFVCSGIYDSGFKGKIGCTLHVTSGSFKLQKGARIAQFYLITSDKSDKMYDGSYGTQSGFDSVRYK